MEAQAPHLVTWDKANRGEVLSHSWVAPKASADTLRCVFNNSLANLTDGDIRGKAGGQELQLRTQEFPEGYVATEVVDTASRRTYVESWATRRYDPSREGFIDDVVLPGQLYTLMEKGS